MRWFVLLALIPSVSLATNYLDAASLSYPNSPKVSKPGKACPAPLRENFCAADVVERDGFDAEVHARLKAIQGLTLWTSSADGWLTSEVIPTLSHLGNPAGNKTFQMGDNHLEFRWTQPVSGPQFDGALEIQASGNFSGDLLHVHQFTGNPGVGTHLIHAEATDPDVIPIHVVSGNALAIHTEQGIQAGSFVGPLTGNVTGNLTGNVTGTASGNPTTAQFEARIAALEAAVASFGGGQSPVQAPTCTAISPTSGPVGTVVTVSGTAFATATAVTFPTARSAAFSKQSDAQITASVPASAVDGAIVITTASPTPATCPAFDVTAPDVAAKYVCKPSQCPLASDSNAGTLAAPWATVAAAIKKIRPTETLYIRGGATDADVKPNANDSSTWYAEDPNTVWKEVLHWPLATGAYTVGASANNGTYPATGIDEDNRVTISCYPGEYCRFMPDEANDLGWGYNGTYPQPQHVLFVEGVGTANTCVPDADQPRYVTLKNIILDARNVARGGFKFYGRSTTHTRCGPHHWVLDGIEVRYGRDENSFAGGHHQTVRNSYIHHHNAEYTAHGPCLYMENWENTIENNVFEECLMQGVKANNGYDDGETSYHKITGNTFKRIGYNSFNATRKCWNRTWGQESGGTLLANWAYCPGSTAAGNTVSCTCQTSALITASRDPAAAVYLTSGRGVEVTDNTMTGGIGTQITLSAGTYGCLVKGNTVKDSAIAGGYAIQLQQSVDGFTGQTLSAETGWNPTWYTVGGDKGDMAVVGTTLTKPGVHDCYIEDNLLVNNGTRGNTALDGTAGTGQQMNIQAGYPVIEGNTFSGNTDDVAYTP